ncbi:MAG: phage tail tape measure protein [Rhodospirillaceae bacterium]|nr:MAG: phage tail tape measure protein [Rhodospirillaceae bacterium]
MITSYEVKATLAVVDRATPQLERVLELARSITAEFETIKAASRGLFSGTGVNAFASSLGRLEPAVAKVAEQMAVFRNTSIGGFAEIDAAVAGTAANVRALNEELAALQKQRAVATSEAVALAGGRRGSGTGSGRGGGGDIHFGGGVPVPMGPADGHARFGIGPGTVAAAGLAAGLVQDAELSDAITRIMYTANNGLDGDAASLKRQAESIRTKLLDVYSKTAMPLKDIEEAALGVTRLMAPFPIDQRAALFDQVIPAAAMETRLKGGDLASNTESIVGLLHMSGFYKPDEIKRLIPAFTYSALFDPQTIAGMTRAAGYVIPTTKRVANLDPVSAMQMVALLQSSGISNSKAGTWLESAVEGLLPGTRVFTGKAAEQQLAIQKRLGLVDGAGKSLIQGPGGTDVFKGFTTIMEHLQALGDAEKSQLAHDLVSLGGKQGARALAMFTDPIVLKRSGELMAGEKAYEKNQPLFWQEYQNASPVQQSRTALSEFNRVLIDLGDQILPPVTSALRGFTDIIKAIRGITEDNPLTRSQDWISHNYFQDQRNRARLFTAGIKEDVAGVEAHLPWLFPSADKQKQTDGKGTNEFAGALDRLQAVLTGTLSKMRIELDGTKVGKILFNGSASQIPSGRSYADPNAIPLQP